MICQSKEVFISYHTDSSSDTVKKICAALEGVGVSCWYAPRDVTGNYAQAIVQAIRGSRVFLLLLNEYSGMSPHVMNELNCAFDRFKDDKNFVLLPFRIGECSLSDDLYYYIGRIHIMDGSFPPEMLRIRELVDRICLLLDKKPERTLVTAPEKGAAGNVTYRITGTMVYPDTRFVGREEELKKIHDCLAGVENKLLLVGMGGIGKSELAKMYLKQYADQYDVVLWVPFSDSLQKTLINDSTFPIRGLERSNYPEDSEEDYYLRKLRILKEIADRRVLLVIDNFDVKEDPELERFCSGSYGVIFTTRYHQNNTVLPEVEICGMEKRQDLVALFRSEYTRNLDAQGLATVDRILDQLDGHPLSIRLVASAMQSRRLTPQQMEALLANGAAEMARSNAKAANMIFGRLRQVFRLSTLSEDEVYLLRNLSLLPIRGITVERLFDWCEMEDYDIIDDLIQKSWVIYNPVSDEVHLHPLVAELMSESLQQDPSCCEKLVRRLKEACIRERQCTWEEKLLLNDYANCVYERLPKDHPMLEYALMAKAQLLVSMSLYIHSVPFFQQLLKMANTLEHKLYFYHKISHALVLCGEAADARDTALEGIRLLDGKSLNELTRLEGCYYNELCRRLTESNIALGEYGPAVEYGRLALSFCDDFPWDSVKENRGWVLFHLSRALYFNGELKEAKDCICQAIALFEEENAEWSASYSYAVYGQILMQQGRFKEALEMNRKSYDILVPRYGTEHADIGTNMERCANIYSAMGDHQKAAGYYQQAADIFEKNHCYQKAQAARSKIRMEQ